MLGVWAEGFKAAFSTYAQQDRKFENPGWYSPAAAATLRSAAAHALDLLHVLDRERIGM